MNAPTMTISTTVNGRPVSEDIPCGLLLHEYIRDYLGLTGTKVSCGVQICGACTVLIDGRPVSACSTLAAEVDGAALETIEGLEDTRGGLHPIQQAFIDCNAFQCGYCTPGMVMAVKALLERSMGTDEAEVRHWLEGNICRCGAYRGILAAVTQASDEAQGNAT